MVLYWDEALIHKSKGFSSQGIQLVLPEYSIFSNIKANIFKWTLRSINNFICDSTYKAFPQQNSF